MIIPHLNQPEALQRCLGALANSNEAPEEVVVADNGSDPPPPADLWSLLPEAQLIHVAEPGPGPARNEAVAKTTAELLIFLDADCLPGPHWVTAAKTAHRAAPETVLGGDVRIGPSPATTAVACYESVYAFRMDRYIAREQYTGAGNMAVPRTVWEAVGPFGGVGIAEDRDWGRRASAKGFGVAFVPDMLVHHPSRDELRSLKVKWDRQIGHAHASLAPGLNARLRWIAKTLALPLSPLVELPRILTTSRLTGSRQRALAFAGLVGIRMHRTRRMAGLILRPDRAPHLAASWNRA